MRIMVSPGTFSSIKAYTNGRYMEIGAQLSARVDVDTHVAIAHKETMRKLNGSKASAT